MEVKQYNREVKFWTKDAHRKMRNEVLRLVLNIGPGYENFYSATSQYSGEVNKIGFSFPYYMVFVHKGAGRGYGGNGFLNGKRKLINAFTKADGSKGTTNPSSVGKMGTGRRKPKPFFNPILEAKLPELGDIITDYKGTKAIDRIQNAFNKLKID